MKWGDKVSVELLIIEEQSIDWAKIWREELKIFLWRN